jgi:four helix bundle protein
VSERYSYRNLILWQKAQELAYEIIQLTKRLPNTWASGIIARQIIASATSIAANIAEGHGRFSIGAHRNHLSIARGSATETDGWLDLIRREGWMSSIEEEQTHQRCQQIIGMLTTKINQLNKSSGAGGDRVREWSEVYAIENTPVPPFSLEDYVDNDNS